MLRSEATIERFHQRQAEFLPGKYGSKRAASMPS